MKKSHTLSDTNCKDSSVDLEEELEHGVVGLLIMKERSDALLAVVR